jgi:hypothetical protein
MWVHLQLVNGLLLGDITNNDVTAALSAAADIQPNQLPCRVDDVMIVTKSWQHNASANEEKGNQPWKLASVPHAKKNQIKVVLSNPAEQRALQLGAIWYERGFRPDPHHTYESSELPTNHVYVRVMEVSIL